MDSVSSSGGWEYQDYIIKPHAATLARNAWIATSRNTDDVNQELDGEAKQIEIAKTLATERSYAEIIG